MLYNARKQFEQPLPTHLPPSPINAQITNDSSQSASSDTDLVENLFESIENIGTEAQAITESLSNELSNPNQDLNTEPGNVRDEQQRDVDESLSLSDYSIANEVSEEKFVLPNVELCDADSEAIDNVFNESKCLSLSDSTNIEEEQPFFDEGVLKMKKIYDSDCEMIYPVGVKLVPKDNLYEIKKNDILSDNIPFKQNVSKCFFCLIFRFLMVHSLVEFSQGNKITGKSGQWIEAIEFIRQTRKCCI